MNAETEKPDSSTRVHHPYSPSSLQCREACPKFKQREGDVHEMAIIGTRQHDAVDSGEDDLRLSDFRALAVAECIAFCEQQLKKFPGGKVLKEVYLPIDDEKIVGPDGTEFVGTTAGYLDFSIISADETEADITDWKFGNNAVEDASNNLQGMGYSLGLLKKFPKLQKITVRFVMPHIDHVSEHTFVRDNFGTMYLRILTVVHRSIEANRDPADFSLARANASSCRFCALIGKCPKVAEMVIKVGQKYAPLKVPENIHPTLIGAGDPKDAKDGIALADIVKTWAEAYKRQASAWAIDNPKFVPEGYTLVEMTKRTVKDAHKLAEVAKQYLPTDKHAEIDRLFDIPIGKCEELISLIAPRGSKESQVREFGLTLLSVGAVEQGTPYAFLRQSRKSDSKKK